MLVYLAGPIFNQSDAEAHDWREEAKRLLFAETSDPMSRDYRGKEDENVSDIVEGDKVDIQRATHILVNASSCSAGTSMEVIYSHWHAKDITLIIPKGQRVSPWLRYHSTRIVHSVGEAAIWLNGFWWKEKFVVPDGSVNT
jgi:hypothetical protein